MNKQIGAIMLVAGTCVGSGMIALPMALAKIGLIPSIILMLALWMVIYYTSLVSVELNLQANKGLALGALAKKFSGKKASFIGTGSYKILSYSLLAVYLYGGASVIEKMLSSYNFQNISFVNVLDIYTLSATVILALPIKYIDIVNRFLFLGLIAVIAFLVIGMLFLINFNNLPLFSENYSSILSWQALIPITFTCFGFQVIFHTLTNYCHKDPKMLKKAFFWGSLLPAIIYMIWTASILGVIYQNNLEFYNHMQSAKIEVGDLVQVLSNISHNSLIQTLVWWLSVLAIITSALGVGLALLESIKEMLPKELNHMLRHFLATIITLSPSYLLAKLIPNAFISVLGFAGMILVIIAILLPIYLITKIEKQNFHYPEIKQNWLLIASAIVGISIMLCELMNILK